MEGEVVLIHRLCIDGGWLGRQRCEYIFSLLHSSLAFVSAFLTCSYADFPSQTVLILKYILHAYGEQYTYYGYANVSQNVALMLSAIVLWISQSAGSEYEYNLSI